ncbi:hypothetical protein SHKM778_16480 [Streptomyces sp. KM77-8]|uniref:Penicillin binding protein A dimerisation domain-containing protein n=1 Tax=Streptomyces haneummycinicus TaxID=3074435 RepID=A0AAT9HD78_9ACTN
MSRNIRHAALFCALLLVALLVNATRVQVLRADAYDSNPANRRDTIARYQQPRGDILVDGRPVTGSRDTGEHLRYERTYREGPLYAPVTGFASQEYGTTLLEHTEDGLLSGDAPVLAPLPLWNEFTRGRNAGGHVVTTIDPAAQRAAYEGCARGRGRWRRWSRRPGGSWRWCRCRRTIPRCCPGTGRRRGTPGRG